MVLFKDNKERGWPSPSWDFKAPSLPLKSLKIVVVRRPQTPKSMSSLKIAQNGAPQGLRGIKHIQTTKHSKQTIQRAQKQNFFILYTKLKNSSKIGKNSMQEWVKRGKIVTLVDLLHKWWTSPLLELKTAPKLQEKTSGPSRNKKRCNTMCLCAIVRHKHTYTHTKAK